MHKAIGIARQSRGDEASKSIPEQTARIREHCKREGWGVVGILEEQDVSGGTPLASRAGLREAVEAVEAGKADVIVVAYFDRLVRSVAVQAEVTERVEAAGGRILALDIGEVSGATAGSWLSGSMLGTVAEYHRRTTAERVLAAHERLSAEGKWLGGKVPFGYALNADGRLTPVPADAALVREAYAMRARGDSLESIRAHVGVKFTSVVSRMLANEVYRGVVRHGSLVNETAHEAIIDGPLFRRVAATHTPRGKRPASDRLLARLEVLRCGSCGSRMVVHGAKAAQVYRCGGGGCARKFSISCHLADEAVTHAVRLALSGREGRAGVNLPALQAERDRRVEMLDIAIDSFSTLQNRDRAKAKLAELEAGVEAAEDALAEGREAAGVVVAGGLAWEEMGNETRRAMIRAAVAEAVVGPGTGKGRVRVTLSDAFAPEPTLDRMADEAAEVMALVLDRPA